jgi:nitrogen fixation NifU-like protein
MSGTPEKDRTLHQPPKGVAEKIHHINKGFAVMSGKGEVGTFFVIDILATSLEEDLSEYSPMAQALILNRENMGRIDHPDLSGKFRGCCGDSIQIDLLLDGKMIKDARYSTDGCYATMACGGIVTRLIKGKSLTEAAGLEEEDLIKALGGLPQGHVHCAVLAVKSLRKVLSLDGSNGNDE